MSYENEELKPLSSLSGNNDGGRTSFPSSNDDGNDKFVSIDISDQNPIEGNDSNYIFFFGNAQSGKSVILSSMLYYFSSQAGVLRPKPNLRNSKEADILLFDFLDNMSKGVLPERTTRDKVTRMDLVFEPNNKSKKTPSVNLTFLETSGENHGEIKRGGEYHSSIEKYLNANVPLNFILVTSYDRAHEDDALMITFLNELEKRNRSLRSVNAILVISKWDKSGAMDTSEEELNSFIKERMPMTNQRLATYSLYKTYYTVGKVENRNGTERLTSIHPKTAEVLSNWLYNSITGYDIDYEGTLGERIKWSLGLK